MSGSRAPSVQVGASYPDHKQSDRVAALTSAENTTQPSPVTPKKEKRPADAYPTPSSSSKKRQFDNGTARDVSPTPQPRSRQNDSRAPTTTVIDVDTYVPLDPRPESKPEVKPRMISPPLKSAASRYRRDSTTASSVPEQRIRTQQHHIVTGRARTTQRASGPVKARTSNTTIKAMPSVSSSAESKTQSDVRAFQKVTSDWSSDQRDDLQAYVAEIFDKELSENDLPASLSELDIDSVKRAARSLFRHLSNFVDLASED